MPCSFVPPYLLRHVLESAGQEGVGDAHVGDRGSGACATTLRIDRELREQRATLPRAKEFVRPSASAAQTAGRRVIHDAQNTEELPGVEARDDDDPATGDLAVDEAHASAGEVWDLFQTAFGWPSVDGGGSTVIATVRYGRNYDNAFWDGQQLVFGDGDGEIFERFTKPMDVMAHEFSHGVVQFTANLEYRDEPGALNESVADVFAAMTLQQSLGQTVDQGSWLIGERLFRPGINATALRSMREPGSAYDDPRIGRDPQVGSMADFVVTEEDSGGVHINSGIPNRAFALFALALGGFSWERAGRVWFAALTSPGLPRDADFARFARATLDAASATFPDDPTVGEQLHSAWQAVGVLSAATSTTAGPAPALSPAAASAERISVRRSGGFAGITRSAELDLTSDPRSEEVRRLLREVDLREVSETQATADRFVYTVKYGEVTLQVPEPDLPPALERVVSIVLELGHPPRGL